VIIRRAFLEDAEACSHMDASTEADHVWQMEERSVGSELQIAFRQVKLPRPMRVPYPRKLDDLAEACERDECFLVAVEGSELLGFIDVRVQAWDRAGWVHHLVVARRYRRKGVGMRLVQVAADWARRAGLRQIVLECSTKNYPGLCFCQRLGSSFCGFNDQLYSSQDIAVFFAYALGT